MKLRKLELYGFKSFADKTVFEFEDNLSALVGPNGSGKSNVVDAIKWVLGERSAQKLRGTEMTNVIFSGSVNRKPLDYAEVKLSIDNADRWLQIDCDDVVIGRRVDRSGQSDYFLNGNICRLKDIRELLMDTGMGNSSYSFIEQGQIDSILRSSPTERRAIFEEAAGINRFLDQKRDAERKLERVGVNLARVSDILEEVQRQLRSVKYQAGRARTYKQHTERLQRLRLASGLHTHRELCQRAEENAVRVEETRAEEARLGEAHARQESELEAARERLGALQARLGEARQTLTRVEARLEGLSHETELNRKHLSELDQRLGTVQARRQALDDSVDELKREVDEAAEQLKATAEELDSKKKRYEEARREIDAARLAADQAEDALEDRKATVFDLFQRESQLSNQVELLSAQKSSLLARQERTASRTDELAQQIDRVEAEKDEAGKRCDELAGERDQLAARVQDVGTMLAEDRALAEEMAARISATQSELSGMLARREMIEDMEARAEGVRSGAKKLLEVGLPGTVGLVADVLEAPLDIAPAVEAALSESVQAVIFETAEQARRAMALLAEEKAGRADLIVLELLRPVELLPVPAGSDGRLSELVSAAPEAAEVSRRLLGNAFLTSTCDAAAPADVPGRCRLVTRTGEVYHSDGLWSGGVPDTPNLITRHSELAELEQEIEENRALLSDLTAQRDSHLSHAEELEEQREALRARSQSVQQDIADVGGHQQALKSRAEQLRQDEHHARAEQDAIRQDLERTEKEAAALTERVESARRDKALAQEEVQAQQSRLRELQHRRNALNEELSTINGELAASREQHRNAESLLQRLGHEIREKEAERAALDREQEEALHRQAEARQALEAATREKKVLEERRAASQAALAEHTEGVGALREDMDRRTAELHALGERRQGVGEQLQKLRLVEQETSIKIEDLTDRTAEDCGVQIAALELPPEQWLETPLFSNKLIREYTDQPDEPEPEQAVAGWYSQVTGEADEQSVKTEEGPEIVPLSEAAELRDSVLSIADDPEADWPGLRSEMQNLKAKVERIGSVNVDAIREQDELEIRLQFLTDQKEDLEKARRHEREIIRELSRKSRERFQETFEKIRESFQALFRKLFGGGSADLVLDEEAEDLLEAGIELTARPPGKQTSSLTLLSGGERALTTAALLFAVFQAKPSPFCLLDEVDAPLDDSNVERFLRMVLEFSTDTQFVVVTHNKQTMGVAQILYGLTMTDGVSRQISVKFEDVERTVKLRGTPQARAG